MKNIDYHSSYHMIDRIDLNKQRLIKIKGVDSANKIFKWLEKDSINNLHFAFLLHQRAGLKNSDIPTYGLKEREDFIAIMKNRYPELKLKFKEIGKCMGKDSWEIEIYHNKYDDLYTRSPFWINRTIFTGHQYLAFKFKRYFKKFDFIMLEPIR